MAVDAARCVNAGPDAFSHGAQIEFSVHHDQRSDVWIAERILMIKAKRKRAKADDDAMDLVDIGLTDNSTASKPVADSLQRLDHEAERKVMDLVDDPNLVMNQHPDIEWQEDHERKYKATKSSMAYDMRIYVDVPFDADDEVFSEWKWTTKVIADFLCLKMCEMLFRSKMALLLAVGCHVVEWALSK